MTVVKCKEIVFLVLVIFLKKKKTEHFSKYINIKIEMNLSVQWQDSQTERFVPH